MVPCTCLLSVFREKEVSKIIDTPLTLRHRSRWEALDAGILLWRNNFPFLLLFYALPLWLCAFALRIIPENFRYISWLALWLLKPLFERHALHVISVRFFEKGAGFKRLFRGLFKTLTRGLAADLSWRRFSPMRGSMMPVRALEAPGFKQAIARRRVLKTGNMDFCSVLTAWSLIMEAVLLVSEILFVLITLEVLQPGLFSSIKELIDEWEIYFYAAWCVNSMLMGSLYVCMGFTLYLNARVELEGWDLEILFRGLAEKTEKKSHAQKLAVILFCVFLILPHGEILAQEDPSPVNYTELELALPEDVPLDSLQVILDSPDFGGERDGWGIRLKHEPEKKPREKNININPLFEKIKQVFAIVLRILLAAVVVFLAVLIFINVRKFRTGKSLFKKSTSKGIIDDIHKKNPNELLAKSQECFEKGLLKEAWGLCIAALFRALSVYRGIEFLPGATEYECLNKASSEEQGLPVQTVTPLIEFVNYWIAFAYAGKVPPNENYLQAVSFCGSLKEILLAENKELPPLGEPNG